MERLPKGALARQPDTPAGPAFAAACVAPVRGAVEARLDHAGLTRAGSASFGPEGPRRKRGEAQGDHA